MEKIIETLVTESAKNTQTDVEIKFDEHFTMEQLKRGIKIVSAKWVPSNASNWLQPGDAVNTVMKAQLQLVSTANPAAIISPASSYVLQHREIRMSCGAAVGNIGFFHIEDFGRKDTGLLEGRNLIINWDSTQKSVWASLCGTGMSLAINGILVLKTKILPRKIPFRGTPA
jgi:hypothetical protein